MGLCRSRSRGDDLDQVPAGVIKDGGHNGAQVGRRLGEFDAGGFKEQLQAVRLLRGDHGEPRVLPYGHVVVLLESENLGLEGEGLGLVVNDDVGQCDPHASPPGGVVQPLSGPGGVSPTRVGPGLT